MTPQDRDPKKRVDMSFLEEEAPSAPPASALTTEKLPQTTTQQPVVRPAATTQRRRITVTPPPQRGGFNPRWITGGLAALLIFLWVWQMFAAWSDNSGKMTEPETKTSTPPIVTGVGPHTQADPGCGLINGYQVCDAQPEQNGPEALNFVVTVAGGSTGSGGLLGNALSDADATTGIQIFENCVMDRVPGRGTGCRNQALTAMESDSRAKPYNGVKPALATERFLTGKQIDGVKTLQVYGKPESDPFNCGNNMTCQYFSIQLLTWPTSDDSGKTVTLAKHFGTDFKFAALHWKPETIITKPAEPIEFYNTATFWPRVILWSLLWLPIATLLIITKMIQPPKPQQAVTVVRRTTMSTQGPGSRRR